MSPALCALVAILSQQKQFSLAKAVSDGFLLPDDMSIAYTAMSICLYGDGRLDSFGWR
jgi:hypothetical protein